jgi:Sphingosine kinase and enzymes related to eukaryotic diacylglycerol kinase
MKHVFIMNPVSGAYDRTAEMREKVKDFAELVNEPVEVHLTERPHHAQELARAAAESVEPVRIYACGGDGTLHEVAAGAAGYENAAITNLPIGSGNDFVRMFGQEAGRFFDLREFLDVDVTPFDMMDCNGHLALNIVSVGIDARVGFGMAKYRRSPSMSGARAYQASVAVELAKGINRHIDVELPEQTFTGKRALVCVLNGRFYGGGFNPSPTARPDDGEFDILVTEKVSLLQVAKVIDLYAKGRAAEIPHLIHIFKGSEVRIICTGKEKMNLDGEQLDEQDVLVKLSEKKVNFFYPRGAKYW